MNANAVLYEKGQCHSGETLFFEDIDSEENISDLTTSSKCYMNRNAW